MTNDANTFRLHPGPGLSESDLNKHGWNCMFISLSLSRLACSWKECCQAGWRKVSAEIPLLSILVKRGEGGCSLRISSVSSWNLRFIRRRAWGTEAGSTPIERIVFARKEVTGIAAEWKSWRGPEESISWLSSSCSSSSIGTSSSPFSLLSAITEVTEKECDIKEEHEEEEGTGNKGGVVAFS